MSNLAPMNDLVEQEDSSAILKLIRSIPDLLSEAYETEVDAIKLLAESFEDFQDYNAFTKAGKELDNSRSAVLQYVGRQFAKHLDETNTLALLEEDQALNFHTDELSIVTDREIDYQLMLEKGFSQSNHNFDVMLVESGWKFCKPATKTEANSRLQCVRPGFLAMMLQDALDQFISDKQVARIAYRFIGAKFFNLIRYFFHDITPELKAIVGRYVALEKAQEEALKTSEQTSESNPSNNAFANSIPSPQVSESVSAEDIAEINNALGTKIDVTGLIKNWDVPAQLDDSLGNDFEGFTEIDFNDISPDTQIRTASIDDVTKLLKTLTHSSLIDTDKVLDTNDVRSALKESLSHLSDDGILTVIDRVSENVLNLVSHLFDSLNQTGGFITEVQNQFARLQPPVMQVALNDTKLFQSGEHPVREYLNKISDLGVRISDADEEGFIELRDSVNTLLKDFSGDLNVFEGQTDNLSKYMDESVYAIKHADGNYEAKDYDEAVKHGAIADFLDSQNHLLEKELTFHKLIKYVWGSMLSRVVRRHGTESEEWQQCTETYASILWSTQIDSSEEGKREILRSLPKIVQTVRSMFSEYGLKPDLRDAILEHMIQLHLAIMRGTDGKQLADPNGSSLDIFKSLQGTILEDTDDSHQAELDAVDIKSTTFDKDPISNMFERFDQISPFEEQDAPKEDDKNEVDWGKISVEDENMITEIRENKERDQSKEELQAVFTRLNQLALESVFMLTVDDQEIRCKLVKKSVTIGTFTFKAFDSNEMIEKNKAELAVEVIRGTAKQIDDHNMFDNALERVVMQIQANSPY